MKTEALNLALEALEDLGNHDRVCPQWPTYAEPENYPKCNCGYDQAITAIKAALKAKDEPVVWNEGVPAMLPKQKEGETFIVSYEPKLEAKDEPVAWMCADESLINKGYARFSHVCMGEWKIPVYTIPPQRKPLSDEEIEDAWASCEVDWDDKVNVITLARAIEAAHKIKGEA